MTHAAAHPSAEPIAPALAAERGRRFGRLRRRVIARVYLVPCALMLALAWPALFGEKWMSDAGLYSVVAANIAERGEWWTLSDGYGHYFNKPPLAFWVRAAFVRVFGLENWATRLPDVLAAVGIVAVLVGLVAGLHSRRAAMLAGVVLATTAHFAYFLPALKLDYLHALLMLLAVWSVVRGVGRNAVAPIVFAGVWVGLALLTKPLTALLVLALLAVWIVGFTGRARLAWWLLPAAGVSLAVAAPWHASMVFEHGELFTQQYFHQQIVRRINGEMGLDLPWHYYFTKLGIHYWPWLAVALAAAVSWAAGRARPPGRSGVALVMIWTIGWFAALTLFTGKGRYYLIPVYPGLAWVCGLWLARAMPPRVLRSLCRAAAPAAAAVLLASLAVAPIVEPSRYRFGAEHAALFAWVSERRDEPIWNEAMEPWTLYLVRVKTGVLLRADVPRVSKWGERRSAAPPGALAAGKIGREGWEPEGEVVFRKGRLVVVRKPH